MAKDPAFPFYAQDYLVDTLRWDRGMKSLHIDLLCESWANGVQALANDHGYIKFLSVEDRAIWDRIKYKWVLEAGFWINLKLEETRTARKIFKKIQSDKGKKSAEKRNNNSTPVEPRLNNGSTLEREKEREEEIIKDLKGEEKFKHEELKIEVHEEANEAIVWPSFDDFYEEYGKKVDRKNAERRWNKLLQKDKEEIMAYLPLYKQARPDKQYRKDPDGFILNECWKDEIIIDNGGKQTNTGQDKRSKFGNYFAGKAG